MELRIGEVAARVERHPSTLRGYEKDGIIPAARRSPTSGQRVYSEADIATIKVALGQEKETVDA